ncbi:MAG: alcohol dehydrogenase catalytic domain-containing protein [Candidatus Dormibacteraceae bacterium]
MRAVRIHAHGGPEQLRLEDVPMPEPGPEDLLVRVAATSVNHRDLWIRRGHPHPAYHVDLPAVLGIDISGTVAGLGDRVTGFAVGDRVTANPYIPCGSCAWCARGDLQNCPYFDVYHGSYAEYAVVPSALAVRLDSTVSDEQAAAFPNSYITAWQMLVGKAQVSPADTVFVWAGTSGLGSAAVDIARLCGAHVIATAGTVAKREVLATLEPDLVLDHHSGDLVDEVLAATGGDGASIVFEHIGQATWERSMQICAPGGTIVSAGATTGDDARMDVTYMFAKQLRILGSRLGTMRDAVPAARHLSAGRLRPLIGQVLPLDRIADAHRLLDEGAATGKIVIRI